MHAWYLYQVNEQLRKQAERQLAIDNRHSTIVNRTNCPCKLSSLELSEN